MSLRAVAGQKPTLSVATNAELSALVDGYLVDGDLVFSKASGLYILDKTSVEALSSTVLATESSNGGALPGRYLFTGIVPGGGATNPLSIPLSNDGDTTTILPGDSASVAIVSYPAETFNGHVDVQAAASISQAPFGTHDLVTTFQGTLRASIDGGAFNAISPVFTSSIADVSTLTPEQTVSLIAAIGSVLVTAGATVDIDFFIENTGATNGIVVFPSRIQTRYFPV